MGFVNHFQEKVSWGGAQRLARTVNPIILFTPLIASFRFASFRFAYRLQKSVDFFKSQVRQPEGFLALLPQEVHVRPVFFNRRIEGMVQVGVEGVVCPLFHSARLHVLCQPFQQFIVFIVFRTKLGPEGRPFSQVQVHECLFVSVHVLYCEVFTLQCVYSRKMFHFKILG